MDSYSLEGGFEEVVEFFWAAASLLLVSASSASSEAIRSLSAAKRASNSAHLGQSVD